MKLLFPMLDLSCILPANIFKKQRENTTQEWALYLLLLITQFLGSHSLIDAAESRAFIRMGFPAKGSWVIPSYPASW
jgi:hypothetical protein